MQRSSDSNLELPVPTLEELNEAIKAGLPPPRSVRREKEISDTKAEAFDRVLDLKAIRAEKAHRNLNDFIREAWHIVEPKNPYVDNWHIGAVCEALEAVATGEIKDLLINIPPRHSKSMISSVMFQPWCWTKWPELRWIYASYSAALSTNHSTLARNVMASQWYRRYFGDKFSLVSDAVTEIKNNKTGYRLTTSVGGMATGRGGDIIVADDPHNVKEAHSDIKREGVLTWWDGTMSTRAEGDPKKLRRIIIMQRVHDQDLSGHVLEQGGYVHLCLPMEYIPKKQCQVPQIGFKDPRTEEGDLLNPKRFDKYWVDRQQGTNKYGQNPDLVRNMTSWTYAGQFQQDPVPLEGGMAKRKWFEQAFYKEHPSEIEQRASKLFMSWDMSFKDDEEAKGDTSYVVGTLWGQIGPSLYMIDMTRGQWGFNDSLKAFIKFCVDHPRAQEKLIEDKANGPAVMNTLRKKISGIIAVDTGNDSKIARYGSVLWLIEAGNVRLPDPDMFPDISWIETVLDELVRFPKASRDDIVDSSTHALIRFEKFTIDPDMFPTGVGEGNRFDHPTNWSADDNHAMRQDVIGHWGVERK